MKVANNAPKFIEVDPSRVTVTGFQHGFTGDREAYGMVRLDDGTEYQTRVAYQDSLGRWQAEGTTRRESPPQEIMDQIIRAEMRIALHGAA